MFYDFPNEWTRIMMCWWRIESTSKWNCLYIVCSCVERLHECEVVLCLWLVTSDQVFCKFKLENLWEIDLPCMYLCTSYIHTYAQACNKRGGRGPPRFWQIRRRRRAAAARRITTGPPGFLTLGASLIFIGSKVPRTHHCAIIEILRAPKRIRHQRSQTMRERVRMQLRKVIYVWAWTII